MVNERAGYGAIGIFAGERMYIYVYDVELPMHSQCYRMGSEGADQSPDVMIHHGGNISE
jgi:hypothetical protein